MVGGLLEAASSGGLFWRGSVKDHARNVSVVNAAARHGNSFSSHGGDGTRNLERVAVYCRKMEVNRTCENMLII